MVVGIAYEDFLSEAVLQAILAQVAPGLEIGQRLTRGGFGYLKRIAPGLNRAAAGMPYVLLTDLNHQYPCAPCLLETWVPGPRHRHFLLRVAVREVEAWVMAHRKAFAEFLYVPLSKVPAFPETLNDPKQTLIGLARSSRSSTIRKEVVPRPGSTATVGRGYNDLLVQFIRDNWKVREAQKCALSLRRAVTRIIQLAHPAAVDGGAAQ